MRIHDAEGGFTHFGELFSIDYVARSSLILSGISFATVTGLVSLTGHCDSIG